MVVQPQASVAERVLGVSSPYPPGEAFTQAYHTLTGRTVAVEQLVDEATRLVRELYAFAAQSGSYREFVALDVETLEEGVTLGALYHLFYEHRLFNMNQFRLWPLYKHLYQQTNLGEIPPNAQALRLGSMSTLTAAAFATRCADILQNAHPVTIDTQASAAKRHHRFGTFVLGNALDLPREWTGTMRWVETGMLLPMLVGTDGQLVQGQRAERIAMSALFRQTHAVLQPGGHLAMCELPPGFDENDLDCRTNYNRDLMAEFGGALAVELTEAGFSGIQIEEGWEIGDITYFFDPTQNADNYERTRLPRTRTVVATKAR